MFGPFAKPLDRTYVAQFLLFVTFLIIHSTESSLLGHSLIVFTLILTFWVRSKILLTLMTGLLGVSVWLVGLHLETGVLTYSIGLCLLALTLWRLRSYRTLAWTLVVYILGIFILVLLLEFSGYTKDINYLLLKKILLKIILT